MGKIRTDKLFYESQRMYGQCLVSKRKKKKSKIAKLTYPRNSAFFVCQFFVDLSFRSVFVWLVLFQSIVIKDIQGFCEYNVRIEKL